MSLPELLVVFCSDTEDNQPNYLPDWHRLGSNYDSNPAVIRWDWTEFWPDLSGYFHTMKVPVTWLIRVDDGPIGDQMLRKFKREILKLRTAGNEIGIHIHTLVWDSSLSKWKQARDPNVEAKIVSDSLRYFVEVLGFSPSSVRMGWNTMSNKIMEILDASGVVVDASAIPDNFCDGKFGRRDNFYDWRGTQKEPYHPNRNDYRLQGDMGILEIPIQTLGKAKTSGSFVNRLSNSRISSLMTKLLLFTRRFTNFNPNNYFYISPWWSPSPVSKIVQQSVKHARRNLPNVLAGFFHAADILDPKTGKENLVFKENISAVISTLLSLKNVNVDFLTLDEAARRYQSSLN